MAPPEVWSVEEIRWHNSAEEYRTIQELARQGRCAEALDRAHKVLVVGQMGRKQTARFHSLVCRVWTDDLQQGSPAAVTHGEEAVRLARLVNDPWVKCEALATLVTANLYLGDPGQAAVALIELSTEVRQNPAAIPGGRATVCMLDADLAIAEDDPAAALGSLEQALAQVGGERLEQIARIRVRQAAILLDMGRPAEARQALSAVDSLPAPADALQLDLTRARLALAESCPAEASLLVGRAFELAHHLGSPAGITQALSLQALLAEGPEARTLAHQALHRAITARRADLVKQIRMKLQPLLSNL